jgi:hypothetical protein
VPAPASVLPGRRTRLGARVAATLLMAAALSVGGHSAATSAATSAASAAPTKTCKPPAGVAARAENVTTVLTGQVTSQQTGTAGTGDRVRKVRRYQVDVDRFYQGTVTEDQVVVTSPLQEGLGRLPTDKAWLFFVNGRGKTFIGNACLGSERATSALLRKVERVLGPGQQVADPPPEQPPLEWTELDASTPTPIGRMVAPGAAASIIGLLGLAVLARARRRPMDD